MASGIDDLRQRVQDAEQHFGLARAEQAKYSTRLIGLIDEVEGRIRAQQAEIERQQEILASNDEAVARERAQVSLIERENEALRAMLHSLLQAIESGGRGNFAETMHTLDQKVTALISDGAADAIAAAEPIRLPAPVKVPEMVAEPEMAAEPEPEIVSEPEAVEVPEPEMLAEPEPEIVSEPEMAAESEPEQSAEPEAIAEPEMPPEMPAEAEPVAEAVEPEPEMVAEAEPQEAAQTETADATLADDVDEAARELAAAPSNTGGGVSDSLHEIMDRVSKLVREAEGADTATPAAAPPAAPVKKSAAG